jgi:hypothetical protein
MAARSPKTYRPTTAANKNYVVVSQDVHYQMAENTTRAVITIPRKMVRKIKVLK